MALSIEKIKSLDLVELLTRYYGMKFKSIGSEYVAFSPFTQESKPSFFVRKLHGRWLFKDFSSGHGGSFIDFVLIKEKISEVNDAIQHIRRQLSAGEFSEIESQESSIKSASYQLEEVYEKIKTNDIEVSRDYLKGRGISEELIGELVSRRLLLHNVSKARSYCCFVVRDGAGDLRCLDNHEIGGDTKFVLGKKHIFSLDWDILDTSEKVFVTEGIVDYLSMKELEGRELPGIALLGNIPIFEPELLQGVKSIVSALDLDNGGIVGTMDLGGMFPMTRIERYDTEELSDPNELLQVIKAQKRTNLSAEKKLQLYREFLSTPNKSELARKWGVDRSYLYEIVEECEKAITHEFSTRKPGRKPKGKPKTLDEAWERIQELENEKYQELYEKEKYYARSELLKVRVKWAEIEAAEARGEKVDYEDPKPRKKQIKKKKNKRR